MAALLDKVCCDVNETYGLQAYQLTARDVIAAHPEGRKLMEAGRTNAILETLAKNAVYLSGRTGRACTHYKEVVGGLARAMPVHEATQLLGVSKSYVHECVKAFESAEFKKVEHRGSLESLQTTTNTKRRAIISIYERAATRAWFYAKNPSRSGDQQRIAWMKSEFYFQVYRISYYAVCFRTSRRSS